MKLLSQGFDIFSLKKKIEDVISKFIKGELERFSNGKASCNAQ